MPGIPVVISDSFGIPVKQVTENAPVMTVSPYGLGIPIVLSDWGAPFIVQGVEPEIELQPFQLDTGTGNGGDTGYYHTIYGIISQEPLAGFTMVEFATRNTDYFQIAFQGDVTEYVEGWYPVIDPPINIGDVSSPWSYNSETDTTASTWVGGEAFLEPAIYQVTWSKS